jgi:hypothetical protein
MRSVVEDHEAGKQLVRFAIRPRWSRGLWLAAAFVLTLAATAMAGGASLVALLFVILLLVIGARGIWDVGSAVAAAHAACTMRESDAAVLEPAARADASPRT